MFFRDVMEGTPFYYGWVSYPWPTVRADHYKLMGWMNVTKDQVRGIIIGNARSNIPSGKFLLKRANNDMSIKGQESKLVLALLFDNGETRVL